MTNDTTSAHNFSMAEHYVGHAVMSASLMHEKTKRDEADTFRQKLIGNLEKLLADPFINECKDFLGTSDWHCPAAVECFAVWYDERTKALKTQLLYGRV